jgi:hypothetical protein
MLTFLYRLDGTEAASIGSMRPEARQTRSETDPKQGDPKQGDPKQGDPKRGTRSRETRSRETRSRETRSESFDESLTFLLRR